jgi:hypothetical protein
VHKSEIPEGTGLLPSVWAMRWKRHITTQVPYKWKARLNVHGGKQEHGVNYWETYSPVVSWTTIRLYLTLSILNNWCTRQVDFVLAFPQADIECRYRVSHVHGDPERLQIRWIATYALFIVEKRISTVKSKLEGFGMSICSLRVAFDKAKSISA